ARVDDVLSVQEHVVPLDGADVLQQCQIDACLLRIAFADDALNLTRLPINDGRQDERQATAGVHLALEVTGTDPTTLAIADVPRQGGLPRAGVERAFRSRVAAILSVYFRSNLLGTLFCTLRKSQAKCAQSIKLTLAKVTVCRCVTLWAR